MSKNPLRSKNVFPKWKQETNWKETVSDFSYKNRSVLKKFCKGENLENKRRLRTHQASHANHFTNCRASIQEVIYKSGRFAVRWRKNKPLQESVFFYKSANPKIAKLVWLKLSISPNSKVAKVWPENFPNILIPSPQDLPCNVRIQVKSCFHALKWKTFSRHGETPHWFSYKVGKFTKNQNVMPLLTDAV